MTELPDALRVPLHELQADVDYLIGRVVADGSCAPMIAASIKSKLNAIETAAGQLREALSKIVAVPTGYHAAAKMEGIARAALPNGERGE